MNRLSTRARKLALAALLVAPPVLLLGPLRAEAADPPPEFVDLTVASQIWAPVQIEAAPDGRIIVLEDAGRALVIENDQLLAAPLFDIRSATEDVADRGLLSMAFDNEFANNGFIYVVYTFDTNGVDDAIGENRLSRFTVTGNTAGSEVVLFDRFPDADVTLHYGGGVEMGPDGKLYVAIGDHLIGANGQDRSNLKGTIIRLNADGSIPTDNPFYDELQGDSRAIYAYGLRNPWQTAKNSTTGQIFISDVGSNSWEELNELAPGANYGWFLAEGDADPNNPAHDDFIDPLFAYPHFGVVPGAPIQGCAIIGGDFYDTPNPTFPVGLRGRYFTGDYCAGSIYTVDPQTGAATFFMSGFTELVDMAVSPTTGDLYYLDRSLNGDQNFPKGGVGKIEFVGMIDEITFTTQPSNVSIAAGGDATFFVAVSAPGDVSYQWRRNGTAMPGENAPSLTIENVSAGDDGDVLTVEVTDGVVTVVSDGALLTITNNTVPVPVIVIEDVGPGYHAGTSVGFSGSATDAEDGTIPPGSLSWEVRLNHDQHDHGLAGGIVGAQGSFIVPPQIETSTNVWVTVYLTATDSHGTSTTTSATINPHVVSLSLETNPAGLDVRLDGATLSSPLSFDSVVGVIREIGAPSSQTVNGVMHTWQSWSDGLGRQQLRVTPSTPTTYSATYTSDNAVCQVVSVGGGVQVDWTDKPGTEVLRTTAGWVTTPPAGTTSHFEADGHPGEGWLVRRSGVDEVCTGGGAPPQGQCSVAVAAGGGVFIDWDPVPGEDRYFVRYEGGAWIATVSNSTSYDFTAGSINDSYVVRYSNGNGPMDIDCGAPEPAPDVCTVQAVAGGVRIDWIDFPGTEILRNENGWVVTPPAGITFHIETGGLLDDGWFVRRTRGQGDEVCAFI